MAPIWDCFGMYLGQKIFPASIKLAGGRYIPTFESSQFCFDLHSSGTTYQPFKVVSGFKKMASKNPISKISTVPDVCI